jgi:hypothetical protein
MKKTKIDPKSLMIGALLSATTFLGIAATQKLEKTARFESVIAENFILGDAKGRVLGSLSYSDEGMVFLSMGKLTDECRANLTVSETEGVRLELRGKRGTLIVSEGPYDGNGPTVWISNADGKVAAQLGVVGDEGKGFLRLDQNDQGPGVSGRKIALNKTNGDTIRIVGPSGELLFDAMEANKAIDSDEE